MGKKVIFTTYCGRHRLCSARFLKTKFQFVASRVVGGHRDGGRWRVYFVGGNWLNRYVEDLVIEGSTEVLILSAFYKNRVRKLKMFGDESKATYWQLFFSSCNSHCYKSVKLQSHHAFKLPLPMRSPCERESRHILGTCAQNIATEVSLTVLGLYVLKCASIKWEIK